MPDRLLDLRERHPELVERVLTAARREGRLRNRPAWSVVWQQLMEQARDAGLAGRWDQAGLSAACAARVAFQSEWSLEAAACYQFAVESCDEADTRADLGDAMGYLRQALDAAATLASQASAPTVPA